MVEKVKIGANIKRARKEASLSATALGQQIGERSSGTALARASVSAWENDRGYPSMSHLIALAQITGWSLDEIVYGRALGAPARDLHTDLLEMAAHALDSFEDELGADTPITNRARMIIYGYELLVSARENGLTPEPSTLQILYRASIDSSARRAP